MVTPAQMVNIRLMLHLKGLKTSMQQQQKKKNVKNETCENGICLDWTGPEASYLILA